MFSSSSNSKRQKVTVTEDELTSEEITGFITCVYDKQWWVACVLQMDVDCEEVTVSFLHPHGPSRTFKYPKQPDILDIPFSDVLTKVDPRTSSGRLYTVTQKESRAATEKLRLTES